MRQTWKEDLNQPQSCEMRMKSMTQGQNLPSIDPKLAHREASPLLGAH